MGLFSFDITFETCVSTYCSWKRRHAQTHPFILSLDRLRKPTTNLVMYNNNSKSNLFSQRTMPLQCFGRRTKYIPNVHRFRLPIQDRPEANESSTRRTQRRCTLCEVRLDEWRWAEERFALFVLSVLKVSAMLLIIYTNVISRIARLNAIVADNEVHCGTLAFRGRNYVLFLGVK